MISAHKDALTGKDLFLKDLFEKLAERDSLASGYIFLGVAGDRPKVFARSLANYLEGGKFESPAKILRETLIIEEKTGSIGIEEIRRIKNYLREGSMDSTRRTIIIESADNLTPQAENALLKITEESPERSLIILILKNTENLLPTLTSRFQKVYFPAVSKKELEERIGDQKIKTTTAKLFGASSETRKKMIKEYLDEEGDPLQLVDEIILQLFFSSKTPLEITQRALRTRRELSSLNLNPRLQLESIFSKN